MNYADKNLTCRDCGQVFTFTTGEQEFHASMGFRNDPSRCQDCRTARKAKRGESADSYSYGGYSFRGTPSEGYGSGGYGRRERGEREMFSATCSDCGNEARVPFQPRGDKPVYCSDCFSKQRSSYR